MEEYPFDWLEDVNEQMPTTTRSMNLSHVHTQVD